MAASSGINTEMITEYLSIISILLFALLLMIITVILILSFIKSSYSFSLSSSNNILGIECIFITIFDIYIDIIYLFILCLHFNKIYNDYFIEFLLYSLSLIIPIIINILFSFCIFHKQQFTKIINNKLIIEWKLKYKYFLCFIELISSFDLNCLLILNSKIFNKSWSFAPIHPFIVQRILFWSVITKFIENILQIYVIIFMFDQFNSFCFDYFKIYGLNINIGFISLIISSMDILIAIYTFFIYKRDSFKRYNDNGLRTSNVQINDFNYVDQTPLAGDI